MFILNQSFGILFDFEASERADSINYLFLKILFSFGFWDSTLFLRTGFSFSKLSVAPPYLSDTLTSRLNPLFLSSLPRQAPEPEYSWIIISIQEPIPTVLILII